MGYDSLAEKGGFFLARCRETPESKPMHKLLVREKTVILCFRLSTGIPGFPGIIFVLSSHTLALILLWFHPNKDVWSMWGRRKRKIQWNSLCHLNPRHASEDFLLYVKVIWLFIYLWLIFLLPYSHLHLRWLTEIMQQNNWDQIKSQYRTVIHNPGCEPESSFFTLFCFYYI